MNLEQPLIKEDILINFNASKQLKREELENLSYYNRSFVVNVKEIKVGDYIEVYYKGDFTIGKVVRKTDKTFFIWPIAYNELNKCRSFKLMCGLDLKCIDSIDHYYFINVIQNHNISNEEIKVSLKNCSSSGKINKCINNFIYKKVDDFGK